MVFKQLNRKRNKCNQISGILEQVEMVSESSSIFSPFILVVETLAPYTPEFFLAF